MLTLGPCPVASPSPLNTETKVVSALGSTSKRYSPVFLTVNARFGVSISQTSPLYKWRTCAFKLPWWSDTCTASLPMLVRVRLVSELMRNRPVPRFNSARESLSAQTLSELVSGRLASPCTQSLTPLGWIETCPLMYCKRATRPGGSCDGSAEGASADG